jgi:hypothetical protein
LSGFVTVTVTTPAAWSGVTAVSWVALTNRTLQAGVVPNERVAPLWKPLPETVTLVPPSVGPEVGAIWAMAGAGAGAGAVNVKASATEPS